MKKTIFISLIFLAFGFLAKGQDKSFTEFDLYGCWILNIEETEQDKGKLIYKRPEEFTTKLKEVESAIYFQAFEECKIDTYRPFFVVTKLPHQIIVGLMKKTQELLIFIALKSG